MTVARAQHTATLLPNGKVLVAGGISGSNIVVSAEVYDLRAEPGRRRSAWQMRGGSPKRRC